MTERELFEAYKLDVYRTCYYMLKNQHDAEDICHEVFIKVLDKDFNSIANLKPWILSIAMNECRNFLKKKSKILLLKDFAGFSKNVKSRQRVEEEVELAEGKEELVHLLSKLKPKLTEVLVLKYLHSLKNEEISRVLNIPVGTVKSRANKGIAILRGKLDSTDNFLNREEIQ